MEIAGRTAAQTIEISGAGDYRAEDLASDTAKVAVSGAGRVVVRVAKTLDVDLSGAATVEYIGDPKVTRPGERHGPDQAARRDVGASMDAKPRCVGNRLRLEQGAAWPSLPRGRHTRRRASDVRHAAVAQERDEHAGDVLRAIERIERQRKPSASFGSNGDESESRSSPPPGASGARCALMTAVGSPTAPRNLRMALLAKICAAISRCAARPPRTAGKRRCAARGSASTETSATSAARRARARKGRPTPYPGIGHEVGPGASRARPPAGSAGTRPRVRRGMPSARGEGHVAATARRPRANRAGGTSRGSPAAARRRWRRPPPAHSRARAWRCRTSPCARAGSRRASRVGEGAGKHSVVPAPARATTITSGSANTVTSSAAPSASRRLAPCGVERAPQMPRDVDRRRAGEERREHRVRPLGDAREDGA